MATAKRSTVVGVFRDRDQAERVVEELHRAGFSDQHIGIATHDEDAATRTRAADGGDDKGEEGAGAGMLAGAGIGGILGAAAVGLIPGIGPIIAAGALAGILGGAAAGAAAGGLVGWLAGQGVPEEEARYYEQEFKSGRTLVTVQADGRYDEALAILRRGGAYDVNTRDMAARDMTGATTATRSDRLELREEELRASKRAAKAGEVTAGKDVVTERVTENVPVRHEEVEVEYHPTARREPARSGVSAGEEISVPVRGEEVVVEKDTVVTGEVDVRKRAVKDTKKVSDTVRREVPRVEREGDVDIHGTGLSDERHP